MEKRTELRFFLKPAVHIIMSVQLVIQCSSILKEKLSHLDHIKMIDNYIRLYFILLPVILSPHRSITLSCTVTAASVHMTAVL